MGEKGEGAKEKELVLGRSRQVELPSYLWAHTIIPRTLPLEEERSDDELQIEIEDSLNEDREEEL